MVPAVHGLCQQQAIPLLPEVPFPLLQAIAEQPEESLQQSLTHLQAAEFLYETHLLPDLVCTFKHALTQEVAYGSLLLLARARRHQGLAIDLRLALVNALAIGGLRSCSASATMPLQGP